MKKEHLILLTAGIMLAVILFADKKAIPVDVIKPGDKGNEVLGLQSAFSNFAGVKIPNKGAYDNSTLAAVQGLLRGSNALIDYDKGYVDRKFASDLYQIHCNSKMS